MSAETNYAKLGLFVLSALALAGLGTGYVAYRQVNREVESFVTYMDESVQGLEVGSPVKFRGVLVGKVSRIRIASDRRHVELTCAVEVATMRHLDLKPTGEDQPFEDLRELRAQLVVAGITGSKFVGLDYFRAGKHPPPDLPFETPKNYLPATPSTLKSIQHVLTDVADRLPGFAEDVKRLVLTVERKLDAVDTAKINSATLGALADGRGLVKSLQSRLDTIDTGGLTQELKATLKSARKAIERSDTLLARVQRKEGLLGSLETSAEHVSSVTKRADRVLAKAEKIDVKQLNALSGQASGLMKRLDATIATAERTLKAVGPDAQGALKTVRDSGRDVERTLRALRLASVSVRKLVDALERDSDMLVKGRARKGR